MAKVIRRIAPVPCIVLVAYTSALAEEIDRNTFNDPPGTSHAEWTATRGQAPQVVESANGTQRFLGEFGAEKTRKRAAVCARRPDRPAQTRSPARAPPTQDRIRRSEVEFRLSSLFEGKGIGCQKLGNR